MSGDPGVRDGLGTAMSEAAAGQWTTGRKVMAIAGGALMFAAVLPWATVNAGFFSVSRNGIEGDGQVTAVLGLLLLVVAAVKAGPRRWVPAVVLSALASAAAVYDVVDVSSLGGDGAVVEVGVGLWMTAAAAVVGVVGSLMARGEAAAPEPAADAPLG